MLNNTPTPTTRRQRSLSRLFRSPHHVNGGSACSTPKQSTPLKGHFHKLSRRKSAPRTEPQQHKTSRYMCTTPPNVQRSASSRVSKSVQRSSQRSKLPNTPSLLSSSSSTCRYIPRRNLLNSDFSLHKLVNVNDENEPPISTSNASFRQEFESSIMGVSNDGQRMLHFNSSVNNNKQPLQEQDGPATVKSNVSTKNQQHHQQQTRKFCPRSFKTLDAPNASTDFYVNLLSWSSKQCLAVALHDEVYILNGDYQVQKLCKYETPISALAWCRNGDFLAVGTDDNTFDVWDVDAVAIASRCGQHSARVTSISWSESMLSGGDQSGDIFNFDIRCDDGGYTLYKNHTGVICGLTWNSSGTLLASGANDNKVNIWDARRQARNIQSQPLHEFTSHSAAVKALSWCPYQRNVLASGGGTTDGTIKFWDCRTGTQMNSVNTYNQVTALIWSQHSREIMSAHGFQTNELTLWTYPKMNNVAQFIGHHERILHAVLSPDGTTIATMSEDETLRFWSAWSAPDKSSDFGGNGGLLSTASIR